MIFFFFYLEWKYKEKKTNTTVFTWLKEKSNIFQKMLAWSLVTKNKKSEIQIKKKLQEKNKPDNVSTVSTINTSFTFFFFYHNPEEWRKSKTEWILEISDLSAVMDQQYLDF